MSEYAINNAANSNAQTSSNKCTNAILKIRQAKNEKYARYYNFSIDKDCNVHIKADHRTSLFDMKNELGIGEGVILKNNPSLRSKQPVNHVGTPISYDYLDGEKAGEIMIPESEFHPQECSKANSNILTPLWKKMARCSNILSTMGK